MNDFQKNILTIVKSGFTGEVAEVDEDFAWDRAVDFARDQCVDVMFWMGVKKSGVNMPPKYHSMLQRRAMMMIANSVRHDNEARIIFDLLKQNNIEFFPLKGVILQYMYPEPAMRFMGDIDILIRTEQYKAIEQLMRNADYDFDHESDHEYVWNKKNVLRIEFHKRLIPTYNKDYFAYYGDGWQLVKREDDEYRMTDEDFFVYIFTHLAKHYRRSGIGLKHFIDIWVYLHSKPDLDEKYIEGELVKLQLLEFYKNVRYTLQVWFDVAEENEVSGLITNRIFSSGVYGCSVNGIFSAAVSKAAETSDEHNYRTVRLLHAVFCPYKTMCRKYTFLKKIPVLLPIMWCVRIVTVLLFRRKNIKKVKAEISMLTKDNVNEYHNALKKVGIDFNFRK